MMNENSRKKGMNMMFVLAAVALAVVALSVAVSVIATDDSCADVNEAKIGDTEYTTLEDALQHVQNDETITMLTNAVLTNGASVTVANFSIDLNTKTVTIPAEKTFEFVKCTISNGTLVNGGTINCSEFWSSAAIGGTGSINTNGTTQGLYLTGGSISGQTVTAGANIVTSVIAVAAGHGTVSITLCNLISESNNAVSGVYALTNENLVTITGVDFKGKNSSYSAVTLEVDADTNLAKVSNITYTDANWGLDVEMDTSAVEIGENGIDFDFSTKAVFWYYKTTVPTVTFTSSFTVNYDVNLNAGNFVFADDITVTVSVDKYLKIGDKLTNSGTITNKGMIEVTGQIINYGTLSGGILQDKNQTGVAVANYNGATVYNLTVDMYKTTQRISMSTDLGATITYVTFNGLEEVVLEANAKPVGLYVNPCPTKMTTVDHIYVYANNKMGYAVEVAPTSATDIASITNVIVTGSLKDQPMDVCASVSDITLGTGYVYINDVCDIILRSDGGPYTYTINDLYISGCLHIYNGTAALTSTSSVSIGKIKADTGAAISVEDGASFTINETPVITADSITKDYDGLELKGGYSCELAEGAITVDAEMTPDSAITNAGKVYNKIESYKILLGTTDITKYFPEAYLINGNLVVNKVVLDATYVSETVKCGATPQYVVEVTGFIPGEDKTALSVYPTVKMTSAIVAGQYTLSPANGTAKNYQFNYISGILTVEHDLKLVQASGNVIEHYDCNGCGRHYTDSTATLEYTIPESGSSAQKVTATADVSGQNATIDSTTADKAADAVKQIKTADPSATIVAEIKTSDSNVTNFNIDSADAKKLAKDSSGVRFATNDVATVFSSSTLNAIATSGKLDLNIAKTTSYPSKYKDLIGVNGIVIDVNLNVNGTAVTQFSDKVTLSFYYEIPVGHGISELKVLCISGDSPEEFTYTYDESTHMVTAETTHFSQYAVTLQSDSGSSINSNTTLYIICAVVAVLAVILAIAAIVVKKH